MCWLESAGVKTFIKDYREWNRQWSICDGCTKEFEFKVQVWNRLLKMKSCKLMTKFAFAVSYFIITVYILNEIY